MMMMMTMKSLRAMMATLLLLMVLAAVPSSSSSSSASHESPAAADVVASVHEEGPSSSLAASLPALAAVGGVEKLVKCHIKCKTSFDRCQNACPDETCYKRCANDHLVQCTCACRALIPTSLSSSSSSSFSSSQERTPLVTAWLQALDRSNLTHAMPTATKEKGVLGSDGDDFMAIAACYVYLFRVFNQCAQQCRDTDEACLFKCGRPAFDGVCDCGRGGPPPATTPSSSPSALEPLAKCTIKCKTSFDRCRHRCLDWACYKDCANEHLARCNCACQSLIPTSLSSSILSSSSSSLISSLSSSSLLDELQLVRFAKQQQQQDVVLSSVHQRQQRGGLQRDGWEDEQDERDTQAVVQCYSRAFEQFDACAAWCGSSSSSSQSEACLVQCARPTFSAVCSCEVSPSTQTPTKPTTESTTLQPPTQSPSGAASGIAGCYSTLLLVGVATAASVVWRHSAGE